jgi:2-C-methyl-D-erythritol 2,4-cyclodiphosphate synthase
MGLGDVGAHFPDTDPALRGVSSLTLLERIREMLAERGVRILNVDSTLILESPRIAPLVGAMRDQLAGALAVDLARVSVKATTNERLGALGRGEGIGAMAVVLVEGGER